MGCVDIILIGIVIIFIFYSNEIGIMIGCIFELNKQLRVLKDFCFNTDMTVNNDKTQVMIIKFKKITYANFVYDNNNLEEVTSYKYLELDLHHKLN